MYQNDPMKVLTGECRLSYCNLTTPRAAQQGGEEQRPLPDAPRALPLRSALVKTHQGKGPDVHQRQISNDQRHRRTRHRPQLIALRLRQEQELLSHDSFPPKSSRISSCRPQLMRPSGHCPVR